MSQHVEHWEGRRALVSGAGGFIGSHERLVRAGTRVEAFVRHK